MKPVDVKSNVYINSKKENNNKDPKFKIGDIVKISKYKNIFVKALFQISLKKFLLLQKFTKAFISDLKGEEIIGSFYKKELQKQIKMNLELEK